MITRCRQAFFQTFESCHDDGSVVCRELLADYANTVGIKLVHDDVLEPGASIGPHTHCRDEEVCLILAGSGVRTVDGEEQTLRLVVVCAGLGRQKQFMKGDI